MKLLTKTKQIIFVVLIAGLVACGKIQEKPGGRVPEDMFTETVLLEYISKTYEVAYIQGLNDAIKKATEILKSGGIIELSYFMELKDQRLKDFLAGN